jgi:hypothetical protein
MEQMVIYPIVFERNFDTKEEFYDFILSNIKIAKEIGRARGEYLRFVELDNVHYRVVGQLFNTMNLIFKKMPDNYRKEVISKRLSRQLNREMAVKAESKKRTKI